MSKIGFSVARATEIANESGLPVGKKIKLADGTTQFKVGSVRCFNKSGAKLAWQVEGVAGGSVGYISEAIVRAVEFQQNEFFKHLNATNKN